MAAKTQKLDTLVCNTLGISKEELANEFGISVLTMAGWSKSMPKPIEIALKLMLENHELKQKMSKICEAHEIVASFKKE
jgi:hypothetical protein